MIVEGAAGSCVSSGGGTRPHTKELRTTDGKPCKQSRPHVFRTVQKLFYSFPDSFCSDDSYQHRPQSSLDYFLIKRKIILKYLLTLFCLRI